MLLRALRPVSAPTLLVAELIAAVILLGLAAVTAARIALAAGPLWRDEVSMLNIARLPTWRAVFDALATDSAPMLYVAVVRLYTWPGWAAEDAALRLLGLGLTVVALGVIAVASRRLDVGVPLFTLALVGAHGLVLDTLAAVRPHGLGVVFALLSLATTWSFVTSPGWRTWIPLVLVCVLGVQTLYAHAVLVAGIGVVAVTMETIERRWRTSLALVAAGVAAGLSVLPYARILERVVAWGELDAKALGLGVVLVRMASAFGGVDLRLAAVWLAAVLLGVAASAALLRAPGGRSRVRLAYGGGMVVVPAVAYVTFMLVKGQPLSYWHFPGLMALVALALDVVYVERPWLRWARLALVVAALPWLVPLAWDISATRRTNVDLIASHLAAGAGPRDVILVNPWTAGLSVTRYYGGPARVLTLPPIDDLRLYRPDLVMERMASSAPLAPLHDAIERALRGGHRLWLVGDLALPPPGEPAPVLPPAPATPTGWAFEPYAETWKMQTGDFLRRHAARWRAIDPGETRPVHNVEHLRFGVVEGWRGS